MWFKGTLNVHPADYICAFGGCLPHGRKKNAWGLDAKKKRRPALDFHKCPAREAYFEDVHHPLEDQGVDFADLIGNREVMARWTLWLLNHYHYLDNCRTRSSWSYFIARYGGPGQPPVSDRFFRGYHCDLELSLSTLFYQHSFKYRLYVVESQ